MMKIITVFLVSLLLTSIPSVGQVKAKGRVDWNGIQKLSRLTANIHQMRMRRM
jgi:hypothetical protein